MNSLFSESIILPLKDSEITYFPAFLDVHEANEYFRKLKQMVPWQQDNITVYGKTYPQPRLTALYGNNGKPYSYSSIIMQPQVFSEELLAIKQKIEEISQIKFTSCLLNLYRDGKDSNGWHADDEKELGINPAIASLSLGQERFFHFRHKKDKNIKHKILLHHGSLLLMQGETQHCWQHQIPKTSKVMGERINLTFRIIK